MYSARDPQAKPIAALMEEERHYEWIDEEDLTKNYMLSGRRAYLVGQKDGEYRGRWNGFWSLPLKIADSVRFGVSHSGEKIDWLSRHCRRFISRLSHIERIYDVEQLGVLISELQFIPDNYMSLCWRFRIANYGPEEKTLRLVANPTVNLMWEAKQVGEVWKERKELFLYDEKINSLIARHRQRSDWIAIFGASIPASSKALGIDEVHDRLPPETSPSPLNPCYGNSVLTYTVNLKANQSCDLMFALTGGSESLFTLLSQHEQTLQNLNSLFQAKNETYTRFMDQTGSVECPQQQIRRAFIWSKANLHALKFLLPGFGLGYMAGLPHFPIYFGRDTAWTALGATTIGDFDAVKESLLTLARFQASGDGEDSLREPFYEGEIPHEVRPDGSIYYYSVDSTPLFVIAANHYHLWSEDDAFIAFLYKNVVKAVEWCINADRDGDGLIEHGPEGFLPDTTWMDSLYRGKSAIDVQAIFCRALQDGARIAAFLGDRERASEWSRRGERLRQLLIRRYWNHEAKYFYDAIRADETPATGKTINAVVPVFFRLTPPEVSNPILEKADSEDFMTEWGARTRAKSDPEYEPRSYQKGGVWPLCTGWVASADFFSGRREEGVTNLVRLANSMELGAKYFSEVLYGDAPPTENSLIHPRGCFLQAWSAGIFLYSVVTGLFGLEPKEPGGLSFAPYLPEGWSHMAIRSVRLGDGTIDAQVTRAEGELALKLINHRYKPLRVELGLSVLRPVELLGAEEDRKTLKAGCVAEGGYSKLTALVELRAHQTKKVVFKVKKEAC